MRGTYRVSGRRFLPHAIWLLTAALMTGCGSKDAAEETVNDEVVSVDDSVEAEEPENNEATEDAADDVSEPEADEEQAVELLPELTEDEIAALQYVESIMIEDYYGDMSEYEAFAPVDTEIDDGYVYYFGHGLTYSASVFNMGSRALLQQYMDSMMEFDREDWEMENSGYSEIEFGELIEAGENKYRIATAKKEDIFGTPYAIKKIYYLDEQSKGAGVVWELEMSEREADDETDAVIDEMAKCYRINLDVIKSDGDWQLGDAKRREEQQDAYEPGEDEVVLEKVDGYRYMGMAMMSDINGNTQSPIMLPMGRQTHVQYSSAWSGMHGVSVSATIDPLYWQDFLSRIQSSIDAQEGAFERSTDMYRNPHTGKVQPMAGYDMARYVIFTYEDLNYATEEFLPKARALCYIKLKDDYTLEYTITLSFEDYDDATNTLLEELETAYGIDLSEFYYENVK